MSDANNDFKNDNSIENFESGSPNESLLSSTKEVETLKEELNKAKSDMLYLKAEFDNYKRNSIKERSDLIKFGSERLAFDLLSVLDNFDRALQSTTSKDNTDAVIKGVELTAKELRAALQKHNINEFATTGDAFDPALHEALTTEETNEIDEGKVFRVFRKGYKFHDKVLRVAQVVVSKKKQ
jgi:molecular chaperone GrpE